MSLATRLERAEQRIEAQTPAEVAPIDVVDLARAAGLEPDDWQADVLHSTAPRLILNCSRQAGKSSTTSVLAVHTALYQPDSLVLLTSPSLRQSSELFRACLRVYRAAGQPVPSEAESALRLELANGSRIVSLPGSEGTIRGYSAVRLLVLDEAARIPDDLVAAVRPMLAVSGGRLVALSTPWGKRGWFYRTWLDGEGWQRVKVMAYQCPRIPREFLEAERAALTDLEFRSEYLCEFVAVEGAIFSAEEIAAATVGDSLQPLLQPLFGGKRWLDTQSG